MAKKGYTPEHIINKLREAIRNGIKRNFMWDDNPAVRYNHQKVFES
ncbi:hypothetical protein ACFLSK_03085 [Chloroflexota bacterium]